MTIEQDVSLLAGVVVRVGDTLYDGSIKTQLSNIRNLLAGGSIAHGNNQGRGNQSNHIQTNQGL